MRKKLKLDMSDERDFLSKSTQATLLTFCVSRLTIPQRDLPRSDWMTAAA